MNERPYKRNLKIPGSNFSTDCEKCMNLENGAIIILDSHGRCEKCGRMVASIPIKN